MRILFVCQNLNSGGAEKVMSVLANNFCTLNHEVSILTISPDAATPFYQINKNIDLINLSSNNNLKKLSRFKKMKLIRDVIKDKNADFVIPFLDFVTIYTFLALRNNKKSKLIVSERCDPNQTTFLEKVLKKHIYKKAAGCIFQTTDARNFYSKKLKKYAIIRNPVNVMTTNRFDYLNNKRRKEIVLVGSNKPEKNRKLAYYAFSKFILDNRFKDWKLKIYGDSSEESDCSLLNELSIKNNVIFMGKDSNWQEKSIDAGAFILTSNYEGLPNALLEAACLQIPCISTNCPVGGPAEILRHGFGGVLVPTNDTDKLTEEMIRICGDKTIQNLYSERNEKLANEYQAKKITKKWLNFMEEILND